MEYYVIIHGFHGTNETAADEICKTKTYNSKYNDKHWLGQGVYFFREDQEQAMSWAISKTRNVNLKNGTNQKPVVLFSTVRVKNSNFLNLNSREGLIRLKDILTKFEKLINEIGMEIGITDENNGNIYKYRCAVFDLIPIEHIKVIQENFLIGKQPRFMDNEIYKKLNLNMQSIQVCVRDISVIDKESIKKLETSMPRHLTVKKSKSLKSVNVKWN